MRLSSIGAGVDSASSCARYLSEPTDTDMHNCTSIVSMLKSGLWNAIQGLATAILLLHSFTAVAQIEDPVTWDFGLYPSEQGSSRPRHPRQGGYVLAHLQPRQQPRRRSRADRVWLRMACGGGAQGEVQECTPIEEYDPNFMLDLKFFEENVYWRQTVDLQGAFAMPKSPATCTSWCAMPACASRLKRCPLKLAWATSATRRPSITALLGALVQPRSAQRRRGMFSEGGSESLPWRRKKA